ncbi:cyclopropane-fatty-acyl-phospholipid synthase [Iodidimonas muriae]|uniref:Cyclopropane-fatty-acyl-phospholipid synthase n=1 Tax=Iodidimonas muriae TaxID=261467 RepID=A0ABQ2LBI1_9PROT|nr:cyclopropane-fatty-acyl-phospholipid synthase family protein [Iodidimonas muriae]GER06943.1 cyclopropane-fatty-acyl-phospholipid synthase [Kordiimonadales bacterium JCM 17843]GGO09368.1 cyclopropane-fatty-acyl-phospholipid synthase [Iodidimonas muriae]
MSFFDKRLKNKLFETCARIRNGSLRLRDPDGGVHDFGHGDPAGELQINDWAMVPAIAARGNIGLGESYVAGLWDTPSIQDLMQVGLRNLDLFQGYDTANVWNSLQFRLINRLMRANSIRGAARNIRAHYDVGNEFYQLCLDESMTYSSAIFAAGDDDLARGQNRKYDRILSRLKGGERVLEIGCGWGGFAARAADSGHHVTGLTISPSQKGYADALLDGRADIRLQDYRKSSGQFDNIVSIEMIEAVGQRYWPAYFATLKARLAENGVAMIQAITVPDANFDIYRRSSDYIRQYIFPGGLLLSDAIIADQARQAGLQVRDSYAFGRNYARTCMIWAERLKSRAQRVRKLGHDEGFLRNWRFYLESSAACFAVGQTDVVQVELAHA